MTRAFKPHLDNLPSIIEYVKGYAEQVGFDHKVIQGIELCVEEVAVNIIRHGQLDKSSPLEIQCKILNPIGLQITLSDEGIPYDPLATREVKPSGYGIILITKLMDEVIYKFERGKNVLILIKYKK